MTPPTNPDRRTFDEVLADTERETRAAAQHLHDLEQRLEYLRSIERGGEVLRQLVERREAIEARLNALTAKAATPKESR